MQWPLLFRPPIPTWTKGRVALAGDAAHPMLPREYRVLLTVSVELVLTPIDQGQGGAQGIEDGVVLGLVLVGATKETVVERLKLYEKIRRNRASIIQIFSNAGQDQPELIRKDASAFMPEDKIPSTLKPTHITSSTGTNNKLVERPEDFFDYNFRYDIIEDSVSQLKDQYPAFELPSTFFQNTPGKIAA